MSYQVAVWRSLVIPAVDKQKHPARTMQKGSQRNYHLTRNLIKKYTNSRWCFGLFQVHNRHAVVIELEPFGLLKIIGRQLCSSSLGKFNQETCGDIMATYQSHKLGKSNCLMKQVYVQFVLGMKSFIYISYSIMIWYWPTCHAWYFYKLLVSKSLKFALSNDFSLPPSFMQ